MILRAFALLAVVLLACSCGQEPPSGPHVGRWYVDIDATVKLVWPAFDGGTDEQKQQMRAEMAGKVPKWIEFTNRAIVTPRGQQPYTLVSVEGTVVTIEVQHAPDSNTPHSTHRLEVEGDVMHWSAEGDTDPRVLRRKKTDEPASD